METTTTADLGTLDRIWTTEKIKTGGPNFLDQKTENAKKTRRLKNEVV